MFTAIVKEEDCWVTACVTRDTLPWGRVFILAPETMNLSDLAARFHEAPPRREGYLYVLTDCTRLDVLASEGRAFDSRGEARKAGFMGTPHPGLHLYGITGAGFWVWNLRDDLEAPTFPAKRLQTQQYWNFRRDFDARLAQGPA